MKNNKRIITENKDYISPYDFATSLGDLHAQIGALIQEHGYNARLDWEPDFHYNYEHNPSPRFNIQIQREETDKEYEIRLAGEQAAKEVRESREREEYARLKSKFGE